MTWKGQTVCLLAAVSVDGALGERDGTVPWGFVPEDVQQAKRAVEGKAVVVGRVTYEEAKKFGGDWTNCHPFVVSRDERKGKPFWTSLSDAAQAVNMGIARGPVMVVGGAQVLGQALDVADRAVLTLIPEQYPDAGVRLPALAHLPESRFWKMVGALPLSLDPEARPYSVMMLERQSTLIDPKMRGSA